MIECWSLYVCSLGTGQGTQGEAAGVGMVIRLNWVGGLECMGVAEWAGDCR